MKYEEALAFLKSREQFHVKVGTRNIRLLARALGHPEHRFPSVVVAGTNGKGSTVAILDSILRAHGLRVGRFTSPHLVSIGERILVNGRQLPDGEFAGLIHDIARAAERLPPDQQPSFFETITGAAFLAFARHEVDVARLRGRDGRPLGRHHRDGRTARTRDPHRPRSRALPGPDRPAKSPARRGRWRGPAVSC